MAKKSRREKKDREIRLSPTQLKQPGMQKGAADSSAASATEPQSLREEYRYVINDLKRIAIIALVMLVILIALALLLS